MGARRRRESGSGHHRRTDGGHELALLGKQYAVTPKGWRAAAGEFGKAGTHLSVADIADARSLEKVRSYKKQMKAAKSAGQK